MGRWPSDPEHGVTDLAKSLSVGLSFTVPRVKWVCFPSDSSLASSAGLRITPTRCLKLSDCSFSDEYIIGHAFSYFCGWICGFANYSGNCPSTVFFFLKGKYETLNKTQFKIQTLPPNLSPHCREGSRPHRIECSSGYRFSSSLRLFCVDVVCLCCWIGICDNNS